MKRPASRILLLTIILGLGAHARGGDLETMIQSLPPTLRSGFASSSGGGTILYHSVNAHAHNALITRATDGTQAVEWMSESAPSRIPIGGVTFVWLAALSGSKGVHGFDVSVNGTHMFRFSSLPDSMLKTWRVNGPDGSRLEFCATEADRFGDLFGYMFLVLTPRSLRPGMPLTLRVTGEAAGSQAWFMTFEHRMAEAAWVRALPALVRTPGEPMQPVSIEIEHYGTPGRAEITMESGEKLSGALTWGLSSFMARTHPVSAPAARRLRVVSRKTVLADTSITLLPVTQRTLYLLPHSHTDIGYSAYQAVVEKNHMRYINEAIDIAERTASYADGASFKWNIEVMWPLESYIASASTQQKARLAAAITNGWIGLNGLYSNVLTGLCRPEELFHLTDFARKASATFGVPVHAAMISDIPAYSSSIVPALGRAGIRYFSSGPNYVPSLPDGGDRIGYALKAWGDRPFYWVSASGQDSVLFWMAGRGYSWFHGLNMGELGGAQSNEIFDYVAELDARHYPYDMIQVRYTVGGDNGPPDPNLPDVVRRWNQEYASPRFAISTTQDLFEKFEKKYGSRLPRYRGDLSPYWEDGAASTARELAENRQTGEDLTQTETLYAMLNPGGFVPDSACRAWRGVHLFDEHTWGASNSISEPDSPDVKAQWEYKRSFLLRAEQGERKLRSGVVKPFPPGTASAIDVVNTCSWTRSDVVYIPHDVPLAGLRAHDSGGKPVPAQRIASGETAILVSDVPPFGFLRIRFEPGEPFQPGTPASASGTTLRGGTLDATVDPATGVISRLTSGGVNFVEAGPGEGLNRYIYVAGRDPRGALSDSNVSVRVIDSGPLVAAISVTSTPAGGSALTRIVRIAAGTDRVDIIDSLRKSRVREPESVHFAFPLDVPDCVTRIGNAFDVIRPETDQLAGSCRDFFCAGRWVDVSNDTRGVLLAVPDAPLVETGSLVDETRNQAGTKTWKEHAGGGSRLYSYAMNNYWHTNYKADQEGEAVFRYAIIPHGAFDPARAERSGIESSQQLIITPPAGGGTPGASLLSIDPSSVIATVLKPASDGKGWMLHMYNPGASAAEVRLAWHGGGRGTIYTSELSEKRGETLSIPITLHSNGIAIVRIE